MAGKTGAVAVNYSKGWWVRESITSSLLVIFQLILPSTLAL
jgi:hypothetical protein